MKRLRWALAIGLAMLVGSLVWHASRHVSPGAAAGTRVSGEVNGVKGDSPIFADTKMGTVPGRQATIRVGTFNIHGGKGRDGRRDLGRVAAGLRDFDFVALNEVLGPTLFEGLDQAEQLGRELGVQWLFAPADQRWCSGPSGNALLTRLPVAFWQRLPLPRQFDRSFRNMLLLGLECPTKDGNRCTVRLLLTHVNRRYDAEREAQLGAVIALYLSLAEPAILLGDLNSDADDPQMRRLLQTPGVVDVVGENLGASDVPGRIDWIIARGLRCASAGTRDDGTSDHPLVWAVLELPAATGRL